VLHISIWGSLELSLLNQTTPIKWGTSLSDPFTVTNGIRQDVLNSYLFAVCFDEQSIQLGTARADCTVRNMIVIVTYRLLKIYV